MEEKQKVKSLIKTKTLQCKNLQEYLKTLPSVTLDTLYTHPTTCLAVFRDLPDIAKHYVIRLLFVEQAVPQAVIAAWVGQAHAQEHSEITKVLSELRVWEPASMPGGLPGWILNPSFRKNAKVSLMGGGKDWVIKPSLEADSKARDIEYLDKYAMERWECVLHYMVGSQQQEGISGDAVRILLHAGLMKRDVTDGSTVITREGFQFLLLDTPAQVWYFMLQYLGTVEARGLDLVICLNFLFQLSFSVLGKDYSTDGIAENLLTFLQHLREFGLVYQRNRKSGKFYPTRLAINLASGRNSISSGSNYGYIVIESNHRIYAYTDSNLQVALLALFTEMLSRFPNLCVAALTRESVRMALKSGITAEQIVGFLRLHGKRRSNVDVIIPPTVVDQIYLWEKERERFIFNEGVLYSQFLSQSDFVTLRDYANSQGVLIWQNERRRTMVVTKQGHDEVRKFWKKHSKGINGVS